LPHFTLVGRPFLKKAAPNSFGIWGLIRGSYLIAAEGFPLSPAPKRRGFGTIVVEAMAKHSLDGAVDLDYASSGVIWRLACPAANAVERMLRS
jgi:hypothetical protein